MSADSAVVLRTAGLIAASTLFWFQYWDLKDRRRPEPRRLLACAFLLGAAAVPVAYVLYRAAALAGAPVHASGLGTPVALVCLAVVGPVEEGAKFLVAAPFVLRWKAFDERVDGVVYGAAVSLGFAAAENVVWLPSLGLKDGFVRALCSPLVHTLFGSIWGLGAAYALLEARSVAVRCAWIAGALALAAAAHGAYDAVVLTGSSPLAVAGVVLVLWAAVILAARRAALRDDRAGAARAAP